MNRHFMSPSVEVTVNGVALQFDCPQGNPWHVGVKGLTGRIGLVDMSAIGLHQDEGVSGGEADAYVVEVVERLVGHGRGHRGELGVDPAEQVALGEVCRGAGERDEGHRQQDEQDGDEPEAQGHRLEPTDSRMGERRGNHGCDQPWGGSLRT